MLIITALVAVVAGSMLGFFLMRSQNENFDVNRSQAWSKALVVAEAGVEEAMALINRNNGNSTALTNWTSGASADGWTVVALATGYNFYYITRIISPNIGTYSVFITNSANGPSIYSIGKSYCKTANMKTDTITRRILVKATSSSSFPGAIVVRDSVDINGNRVTVDSYDSTDPLHSYWPGYPAGRGYGLYTNTDSTHNSIRNARGNVATDNTIVGIISVGNANIYGRVDTGPGGTATVGANGSVGDVSWVDNVTQGIKPGYSADDMNVVFPDAILPVTNWITVTGSSITNSGNYTIDQISANFSITGSNVVLYATNGINFNGNKSLDISSNSSVTLYAGGSIDLGGNGSINNASQHPSQLIVYGLATLTSIKIAGNGAMFAAIYAPSADVSFKGSGSSGGFNGALTAQSVLLTGNSTFSYDEALGRLNFNNGYVTQSWEEVSP